MRQEERRTRIVATLGPASESPEMIRKLIAAGVDAFRLNFSHGDHESHAAAIRNVRSASIEACRPVAVLQDLQGPKIRTGELLNHQPLHLTNGDKVVITTDPAVGSIVKPGEALISTTYQPLPGDVRKGDIILIDDGKLRLRVNKKNDRTVDTEVLVGGDLGEHKGMNLPHTPLSAPCLTEKDRSDLKFGIASGVDWIALSFVRAASDIEDLRREIRSAGADIPIISKIERVEALSHLEEIIAASDCVMVARGDLGVETSSARIPILQKENLATAGRLGKPDITATQMLETMIANPVPTRAEATDVANAVFDGTDAVMLSGETAVGKYPVEAVKTMSEIALAAEQHLAEYSRVDSRAASIGPSVAEAGVHAACLAAEQLKAAAIAVFTLSGRTAFLVASRRPSARILAFTPREETYSRLALAWGVQPVLSEMAEHPDALAGMADRAIRACGRLKEGDLVIILAGTRTIPGATNIIKIHRVGDSD